MSIITLKKRETICLDGSSLYTLEKGGVIVREIFSNGKVVNNECPIGKGELVGNLFEIFQIDNEHIRDIGIEIEALDDSVLKKVDLENSIDGIKNDSTNLLGNMLRQILKKNMITAFYHVYDKKGYILSVFRLYADSNGVIAKKSINPEIFNLSCSQFYTVLSEVKEEKLLVKCGNGYKLDIEGIDKYLLNQ